MGKNAKIFLFLKDPDVSIHGLSQVSTCKYKEDRKRMIILAKPLSITQSIYLKMVSIVFKFKINISTWLTLAHLLGMLHNYLCVSSSSSSSTVQEKEEL